MRKLIKSKKNLKKFFIYFTITLMIYMIGYSLIIPDHRHIRKSDMQELSYMDFLSELETGIYEKVYYTQGYSDVYILTKTGDYKIVKSADNNDLKLILLESGVTLGKVKDLKIAEDREDTKEIFIVAMIVMFGIYDLVYLISAFVIKDETDDDDDIIINRRKPVAATASGGTGVSGVTGKSVESTLDQSNIKTFEDIAGLKEVKRDMKCIVDFLVNKEKYTDAGAKLPKGVILYGPPGTGKTLLAKAVAGEADVPFLYMSGSEFIEMYVGVGAKRVRELFSKARKQAPCIVFIDEIDAIGAKRGENDNGEDRKTINALLTEMDGFKESENIIVIGATNRLEDLDSALMRPGRFTNKFCVPLPETVEERLEIIKIYTKNKKFDETVDFKSLAKELVGFSPAKIEALLNEAAIISVQENSNYITKQIIDKAMYKILLSGHMKEDNSERRQEDLDIVAWHEAGHAVVGHILGKEITKVTIIQSTSGAGGVTFSTPQDKAFYSIDDIEHQVMELYGGRVAEYLLFGENKNKVTTGASNDIERATSLIRDAIVKYGMSDKFGLLNLGYAEVSNQELINAQIEMSKNIEQKTINLLKENKDKLKTIADKLLEHNTIYKKDIEEVFAA